MQFALIIHYLLVNIRKVHICKETHIDVDILSYLQRQCSLNNFLSKKYLRFFKPHNDRTHDGVITIVVQIITLLIKSVLQKNFNLTCRGIQVLE